MVDGVAGWRFFDAESGRVPGDFSPSILPGGGAGRIVALATTPFARSGDWAAQAVVAIARSWSEQELRIFLMDLGLDAPSLHGVLDLPNGEGVSDAFLYGASVQRIAMPALDGAIFFASSGTATTDPEQILAHPRWNDLAGGFSEADATLLLFLPTDIPGADKIMSRATDVLFLAGEGESAEDHLGPASVKVVGTLGPRGTPPEGGSVGVDEPEEEGPEEDIGFGPLAGGQFGLAGDLDEEGDEGDRSPGDGLPGEVRLAEDFLQNMTVDQGRSALDGAGPPSTEEGGIDATLEPDGGYVGPRENLLGADEPVMPSLGEVDGGPEEEGPGAGTPPAPEPGEEPSDPLAIPDFGAEFADLPDLDSESAGPAGEVADEPGEIVPGSDFVAGVPPREEGDSGEGMEDPADESPRPRLPYGSPPDRTKPRSRLAPPRRKKSRAPLLAILAVVVLFLAAAVGTAMGLVSVPGLKWLQDLFGEVPYPALTAGGAQAVDPNLRFSLELDVFEDEELGIAIEMRNTLQTRLPDLLFTLTPFNEEGVVTYVLHAGPATDVVEAENLRPRVAEILFRDDPESWPIRTTPRAFLLGQAESLAEAQELLADAEGNGALAYLLQATYPGGEVGYHVLSGAFYGVEDARYWQLVLRDAGFRGVPLIERRGRPTE